MSDIMSFPGGIRFEGYRLTDNTRAVRFAPAGEEADKSAETELAPHTKKLSETDETEIIEKIREADIDRVKREQCFADYISELPEDVSTLIVNCAECEPYLASVSKQLEEHPEEVVDGAKILMKACGLSRAVFAVTSDCENAVNEMLAKVEGSPFLDVKIVDAKYPVNLDCILFRALTGKRLQSGEKAEDSGYLILSAGECAAVYRRFAFGHADRERLVTVSGDRVEHPCVFLVPVGTPVRELFDRCGIAPGKTFLVDGGPLSGEIIGLNAVVTPHTEALLALAQTKPRIAGDCIMCGACTDACPQRLSPWEFVRAGGKKKIPAGLSDNAARCLGCRLCTYVCPSDIDVCAAALKIRGQEND